MFSQVVRNGVLCGRCQMMTVSWKGREGRIKSNKTISIN